MDAWKLGRGCVAPGLGAVVGDPVAHERRFPRQRISRARLARPHAWWRALAVACLALALAACAARPAPNFRGHWRPVNRFAETPREIPLHQAYVYAPLPLDRTLKSMLTRWARDSRMALSYLHGSDYTLHQPVAHIRTSNLQSALEQLNEAYASQGVAISADDRRITVRQAGASATPETGASP